MSHVHSLCQLAVHVYVHNTIAYKYHARLPTTLWQSQLPSHNSQLNLPELGTPYFGCSMINSNCINLILYVPG